MIGTSGPESSSRMRTWSVSPLESRWETRLPKVLWKSFYVRLEKYAMLGSRRLWILFRSCSAGRDERASTPRAERIVRHGNSESNPRVSRHHRLRIRGV